MAKVVDLHKTKVTTVVSLCHCHNRVTYGQNDIVYTYLTVINDQPCHNSMPKTVSYDSFTSFLSSFRSHIFFVHTFGRVVILQAKTGYQTDISKPRCDWMPLSHKLRSPSIKNQFQNTPKTTFRFDDFSLLRLNNSAIYLGAI